MKCPKCQTENKPTAKFCISCGQNLAVPQPSANYENANISTADCDEPTAKTGVSLCSCGAPIKPGVKFCSVCGKVVSQISGISHEEDTLHTETVRRPTIPPVQPVVPPVQPVVPPVQPVVPPVQPVVPASVDGSGKNQKKKNGPLVAILIILSIITILIIAFLAKVLFTMSEEECSFSEAIDVIFDKDDSKTDSDDEDDDDSDEAADDEEEAVGPVSEGELEPINKLVETGKEKIANNEFDNGYSSLDDALGMYGDLYLKYEKSEESQEMILTGCETAFAVYVEGVSAHANQMVSQSLQKGLYTQIKTDAGRARSTADTMSSAYDIELDTSSLDTIESEAKESLRQRYILEYDALVVEWSRTTAWNLADWAESDGLFEMSDLDDPLRLRWCYAYAGIRRKEIAEDMAAGKKTALEAAQELESMVVESDYNPALLLDCATIYESAGCYQDADRLLYAYNQVADIIADDTGIRLNVDLSLDKEPGKEQFWYFNDLITNPNISSYNGILEQTRHTIRNQVDF